ncbi:MAG TPA: hypothetical protein VGO21_04975 [Candidatus Paceibacterota bacterium]|jgi:hypothetical protein|nr:hypothetical protein [Candidatus Paceibacterota bacterium]
MHIQSKSKGAISTKGIVWTAVVLFLVLGGIVVGLNKGGKAKVTSNQESSTSGTPEGGVVSVSYPNNSGASAGSFTMVFSDAGPHGWHAVQQGGGTFIQYDGTQGLKYKAPAAADVSGNYSATIPDDMCGDVILPQGATPPTPKVIEATLTDANGKPVAGATPVKFDLKCDIYRLKATIKANPDKLLADGIAMSTVTANFSVTGPAKFVNGQRISKSSKQIILTTPLGLMFVHFNTSLGVIAPNPANIKTDLSGNATVTVTSTDAGIAKVMAQASGVGDAQINVHFMPKITGVKVDFVPPTSPTNYQISTIPANPKDLTIEWKFIPAPGNNCGNMTGPAKGLGLSKNGFFHGPQKGYADGCPEDWEHASQIQVTVTDKDGGIDTETFGARDFEGLGLHKF